MDQLAPEMPHLEMLPKPPRYLAPNVVHFLPGEKVKIKDRFKRGGQTCFVERVFGKTWDDAPPEYLYDVRFEDGYTEYFHALHLEKVEMSMVEQAEFDARPPFIAPPLPENDEQKPIDNKISESQNDLNSENDYDPYFFNELTNVTEVYDVLIENLSDMFREYYSKKENEIADKVTIEKTIHIGGTFRKVPLLITEGQEYTNSDYVKLFWTESQQFMRLALLSLMINWEVPTELMQEALQIENHGEYIKEAFDEVIADEKYGFKNDEYFRESDSYVPDGAQLQDAQCKGKKGQPDKIIKSVVRRDVVIPVDKVLLYIRGLVNPKSPSFQKSKSHEATLNKAKVPNDNDTNRAIFQALLDAGDKVSNDVKEVQTVDIKGKTDSIYFDSRWDVFPNGNKQLVSVETLKWMNTLWPVPRKGGSSKMESKNILGDGEPTHSMLWFGESYHIPISDETTCLWSDCPDEKEEYYETLSTERLIIFADYAEYVDDTMPVIRALYKRDPGKAIELTIAILEKGKGNKWLHNEAKEFLLEKGVVADEDKFIPPVCGY